jgi:hypothetical protein
MDEVVGSTRDGDGLQHQLEEQLVERSGADAAEAVCQVVLKPVVARAEAECNLTRDLQKEKRHGKTHVVWWAAGAIMNNSSKTRSADGAVEERGDAEGEGVGRRCRGLHLDSNYRGIYASFDLRALKYQINCIALLAISTSLMKTRVMEAGFSGAKIKDKFRNKKLRGWSLNFIPAIPHICSLFRFISAFDFSSSFG